MSVQDPGKYYLAVDLGAESGRVMLGGLHNGRVELEELHRFATGPLLVGGTMRWDLMHLFSEMKTGFRKAAAMGRQISSVSTDSWAVDYVYFNEDEPMLALPYHYRDQRNDNTMERVFQHVPADEIFSKTGIQFMPINTLYQLWSDKEHRSWIFDNCDKFLLIADFFNYLFSGTARCEVSNASTTQLLHARTKSWCWDLIDKLGLPPSIFPELVAPGSVLGAMQPQLSEEVGLNGVSVIAGLSHDTAAAVAAIPAGASGDGKDWAYISSGTWSLLGMEADQPIINQHSRESNFTNEAGYDGSIRFLKNIIGLWIVQECRREWAKEGVEYDYAELARMAEEAAAFGPLIDPRAQRFQKPGDMPAKVVEYCRQTGQSPPSGHGEIVRCVLESLALLYADVLKQMEKASSRQFHRLHIVGGGCKNRLLNKMTACATGLEVLAGPTEATALGNVLVQALAQGHLSSIEELREVVRNSFDHETFQPDEPQHWELAGQRFAALDCLD